MDPYVELAGVLAAAAAAWAAFRAAKAAEAASNEARRATQAEVVSRLLDEYASAEMLKAVAGVLAWDGTEIGVDTGVDRQRRLVSHYFQKVARLGETGLLEGDLVRVVVSEQQVALFCGVIERMESSVRPEYDRSPFDWLAHLYGGRSRLPPSTGRVSASRTATQNQIGGEE